MVHVIITLQLKHQVWYLLACDIDLADGGAPRRLPASSQRKFLSHEAATLYIRRIVLGWLKHQGVGATDAEITYHMNVRPPAEKPKRA
jgi:hypothetical protein